MSGAAARSLRVARVRGVYNSPTVDFNAAMRLQELLRDCRHSAGVAADPADHLLLLQHSPVYTLGRRTAAEARRLRESSKEPQQHEHLLFDENFLEASGAQVVDTKRGGQVTYHGKGQLVGYPILHLRQLARHDRTLTPRGYIPALESVLANTLLAFGVQAVGRSDEGSDLAGVWIDGEKVAAIGVQISKGVTTHGFALNVTAEPLPFFERIVPCGLSQPVTCISRHCPEGTLQQMEDQGRALVGCGADTSAWLVAAVEAEFVAQFARRFGYDQVHDDVVSIEEMLRLAHLLSED